MYYLMLFHSNNVQAHHHTKKIMSVSISNFLSARRWGFSHGVKAQCEDVFSLGIKMFHSNIRTNPKVIEIKTSFIFALKKYFKKIEMLEKLQAPNFVPHSIWFNPKLKIHLVTTNREDYKELSYQFDSMIFWAE